MLLGYLQDIPVSAVKEYERTLYELLESRYASFLTRVESGFWDDQDIAELKKALREMKR